MGHLAVLAVLAASCSGAIAATPIIWKSSDLGQTAIIPMKSAPYPHASRAEGFKSDDKVFPRDRHYVDNSVGLFIPRGYKPGKYTDLLVYFHGHSNNVRKALVDYRLREQVAASGRNVILVFPEGPKDAPDSGGGRLEERDGLKHLVEEVLQTLAAEKKIPGRELGSVALAGHSGAYRVISFCVEQGGLPDALNEVCLLDASYDRLDAFVDWVARKPDARLFSIFTAHLADENVYLMTHLRRRNVTYELFDEDDVTGAVLSKTRIIFVNTRKLKHDQTVAWLERWLRTGPLAPRAGRNPSH